MPTILAMGPFRLDTANLLLSRGIEPIALGRRATALLWALVKRPGALVSKEALIEAAWPGQTVEQSNLTKQIAALRRILGEEPGGEGWIETLPRRGYRFVGPVDTKEKNGVLEAPLRIDAVSTQHGEAERRQITAMSCELVGVAARADGAGLEDLGEAVGDFHRCVSEIVGRHNGFIASRLGNIVLVLFGYPAAHEHDAEQAVRAGLELCPAVRTLRLGAEVPPMRCRVGIATGVVIVGDLIGVGELWAHRIVGDAPNLAARLQVSAQPDTVAIEPATRRLIGNLFDCCDLGAIATSSSIEPMRIWQVLSESIVASRFEALRGSALTRLVGRDEEIELLLRRWARATSGDGQVVLISGEPGLGKSRITVALTDRLHGESHVRLNYFCSPYHQDSALYPFVDQLGHAAGLAREDPPAVRL
jgi:class 3 adenylate cyclase